MLPPCAPRCLGAITAVAGLLVFASAAPAAEVGYLALQDGACDQLVEHVPDADVTYQPGVDVHGNPVTPADLNPPVVMPDTFLIPLELDLFDAFGIPADPDLFEGTIVIGTVELQGKRVTFNGQPLTDPQSEALATLCQHYGAP
jgi:hypothetical protein